MLVLVVGLPKREALPWLAASMVIHIGYYVTLVGAYRHGELGFAYPVMRGTAPLIVALLSGRLIGEHVPFAAWLGVAGISAGVLAIGLTRSPRESGSRRHALAFALANAVHHRRLHLRRRPRRPRLGQRPAVRRRCCS